MPDLNPYIISIGVLFTLLGLFMLIIGIFSDKQIESGGIIFIGPIPIIFGTNTDLIKLSAVLGVIIALIAFSWTHLSGKTP